MSDDMGAVFGAMLKSAALGGGVAALLPKFETEDEALAYAERIARLKPGDRLISKDKEPEAVERCVYVGPCDNGRMACVLRMDKDNELNSMSIPWGSIWLPEE